MKPIAEVAMLTYKHAGTYGSCPGCAICERIEQLRTQIDRPPEEKYKHILDKGEHMTTNDIKFLLENEVRQLDIQKRLGISKGEFRKLLKNLDVLKNYKTKDKEMVEVAALTKEQLIDYTNAGMSTEEIAKQAGVKPQTVYTYRKKYGLSAKKDKANPKTEYKQAMNEVAAAMVANPDITNKLKARISALESQLLEEHRKRTEAEEKLENMTAAVEDLETENAANTKKARRAEEEMNNFAAEVDEERERSRSYARECERLNDANKDLQIMLQTAQRKEKVYAAALKEALL